ncbi:MAG: MarR family transcriptional regulator [Pseudomonadota bacterium]
MRETAVLTKPAKPDASATALYFRLFNEIGIIDQLASTRFERVLPHGLTQAQFTVLNHGVRMGDGWTPARLAAAFQVTKGTFTSTLQKLEAKGFVRVEPDPDDGRSKRVFLTQAGRAARDDALAAAGPVFAEIPSIVDPKEVDAILPVLSRLRAWLDENR